MLYRASQLHYLEGGQCDSTIGPSPMGQHHRSKFQGFILSNSQKKITFVEKKNPPPSKSEMATFLVKVH
jgi:hypothetical protein